MKKIIALTLSAIICLSFVSMPVFAITCPDKCVQSNILGDDYDEKGNKVDSSYSGEKIHCKCDDGKGSSIKDILNLIVDIMTIGIGILGVIGISVVGIQYLTAGGNEEKTRKAKRRMFEIILGLVAYAVIYALLKFLGVQPN